MLGRALGVLGAFTGATPELALAEIVARTTLPPATAHRFVAELVAWGALERVGRGRYRIGVRLWEVGSLTAAPRTLPEATASILEDLVSATRFGVHLVVADGRRARVLSSLVGRDHHDDTEHYPAGREVPLYAGGAGRVLLAHAPGSVVDAVNARGLLRLAPGTITDVDTQRAALDDVRRTGACLAREETSPGYSSVGVPVFDAAGGVVAALAVIVPDEVPLAPLLPAVLLAAATASRRLGAVPAGA